MIRKSGEMCIRDSSYSGGLKRDHETDFKYLEKVKETFKEDMGFDLTDFLDILSYFSNSFSETIVKKIGNNVFRAPMKELLRDFLEQMNNVITEEDAATLFNYLVVSSQNLKTENGKINFYLPIGKRRTRDTRFELMPLVSINGDIIFSPITMDRLKKDWLNGIMAVSYTHLDVYKRQVKCHQPFMLMMI